MILNRFIDDYFGKVKEASYSEGPAGTPQGLGFLFGQVVTAAGLEPNDYTADKFSIDLTQVPILDPTLTDS